MGMYYGEVLGARLVRWLHSEAEYAEDYEVVWEHEGPYWRELVDAKRKELGEDLVVQTKHAAMGATDSVEKTYIWLTSLNSET